MSSSNSFPSRITRALSVTGTITAAQRVRMTANGNPRVRVSIAIDGIDGTPAESFASVAITTEANSSYVYDVLNETCDGSEPRDTHQRYTFHITGRGNLGKIERIAS